MGKIACVAIVKNESRYIREWIAYQFVIGFDAVILFCNNCTDDTAQRALSLLDLRRDIRITDWPFDNRRYQIEAYEAAAKRFRDEFEWLAFLDADEFLVTDRPLRLMLSGLDAYDAIGVSWAMFGSSGHVERPAGLVIDSYLGRSESSFPGNRHIKSIVRPAAVEGCFNPHAFKVPSEYVDLIGRPLRFECSGILEASPDYAGGKINHYFTRSYCDWIEKVRRGYNDIQRAESEFGAYDRNEVFDDSAVRYKSAVAAVLCGIEDCAADRTAYLQKA